MTTEENKMTHTLYIIELHYTAPIAELDTYLLAHRAYLDESYKRGIFIASGPQNPRTGGIIVARGVSDKGEHLTREHIANIMDSDPFMVNKVATYKITEFNPVKYSEEFKKVLGI